MERKGFVLKGTSQAVEMIIGESTPVPEMLAQLAEAQPHPRTAKP